MLKLPFPRRPGGPGLLQAGVRILVQSFQESVSRSTIHARAGDDHRLVHQLTQDVERALANHLSGGQIEASCKNRKAGEGAALVDIQQVVTPRDGSLERLMARLYGAITTT